MLACVLSAFTVTASPSAASPALISSGEVEVASVSLTSDALALRLRESTKGGVAQDPANVVLRADSETATTVPADPAWSFLGKPGQKVWLLSESDSANGIHPAWDTTGIQPGQLVGDTVQWRLAKAAGPGDFSAFRTQLFDKPTVAFDSANGRDRTDLPVANRDRTTWAFNAAGHYELTFAVAGTLASGKQLSNEAKFVVDVVDTAPTTTTPAPTASEVPASSPTPTGQDATPVVTTEATPAAQAPANLPAQAAPGDTASGRAVLDQGHVDAVAPRFVNGTFQIQIKDSTANSVVWRRVSDVVFHVKPEAMITLPAGVPFLGKQGAKVWMIPQVQKPGVIWAGWSTEELTPANMSGNVTWTLVNAEGPGKLVLFLTGSFGAPSVIFDANKPLPATTDVPLRTHAHGNWSFPKEGVYRLTFEVSGKRASGETVSDRKTYTFAVGNVDPSTVTPIDNENPGTPPGSTPSSSQAHHQVQPQVPVATPVAETPPLATAWLSPVWRASCR